MKNHVFSWIRLVKKYWIKIYSACVLRDSTINANIFLSRSPFLYLLPWNVLSVFCFGVSNEEMTMEKQKEKWKNENKNETGRHRRAWATWGLFIFPTAAASTSNCPHLAALAARRPIPLASSVRPFPLPSTQFLLLFFSVLLYIFFFYRIFVFISLSVCLILFSFLFFWSQGLIGLLTVPSWFLVILRGEFNIPSFTEFHQRPFLE